ncbi:LruC domain-containing protein [Owenweeksia hongkongensis]|uniref:LruC domain-containing protein n=1 Tax=Owenweeksia hongkongensis TaxID=253245 RepID=UPI003A937EC5
MKTSLFNFRKALIATAVIALVSCQKEKDSQNIYENTPGATSLSQLNIDPDFNWSSSMKGNLKVSLTSEDNLHMEGEPVHIINNAGKVLERVNVKNGVANFYIHLPQSAEAYVYYPNTGDSKKINGTGTMNMRLTSISDILSGAKKTSFVSKKSTATVGLNLLSNSAFNLPSGVITDLSFGYQSPTAIDGKWHVSSNSYELNTTTVLNDTVLKMSLDGTSTFWGQTVNVVSGSSFTISSLWQNASRRIVVSFFDSSDQFIGYSYPSNFGVTVGGQHTGTIPANAVKALIWSSASTNSYVDDIKFISTPAISDADGDGVADNLDMFPNDPNRAYQSTFPTVGNQYLAFEDLWPSKGDFDFNDMVLRNQVVFTKDANNYLVDATFTIDLNAVGAGIRNGLGIVLLNTNKQAFGSNIVAGISGYGSENNNIENGIVVFDDAFAAQSTYYTNTGSGPSASPDQFQFTVTFVPNTVNSILPDFYIFRRDDVSHEIHLDGFAATSAANTNLMNTGDDLNGTYNTEDGLPWAIEIITPAGFSFRHPLEKTDILESYPQFQLWATTKGASNLLWFENPISSKVY